MHVIGQTLCGEISHKTRTPSVPEACDIDEEPVEEQLLNLLVLAQRIKQPLHKLKEYS